MSKWATEWTGNYPCYCCGEWKLYKDGQEVQTAIPFQGEDARTFGTYRRWYFGWDYEEIWDFYEDGMNMEEWTETYKEWLSTVADKSEWHDIYESFQENDWRSGCCGGCI